VHNALMNQRIASELNLPPRGVAAVLRLLGEKNTVPFVARYRKEATGDLDEVAIRAIEARRNQIEELERRRATILSTVAEQGELSEELRRAFERASTRAELEDLYLPYKRKRTTRAGQARKRGLEPLSQRILAQPLQGDPRAEAEAFLNADVADADAALAGARDVVAEVVSEDPHVRGWVRRAFGAGVLVSKRIKKTTQQPTKFELYYDFREPVSRIPGHRFLAVDRGTREGFLRSKIDVDPARLLTQIEGRFQLRPSSAFASHLRQAIADGYQRLIAKSCESEVRRELKQRADEEAVGVFADNLRALLLAAPFGARPVIGIDPGLRTGCKCAAVAETGKFLAAVTIFPRQGERAATALIDLVKTHAAVAVAVGNGTGGRETESFTRRALKDAGLRDVLVVSVNEAGASVYSASDVARAEFPHLDLTIRGAISIARRLQDPLAELVKVEPKAIGVGQYQHDVAQTLLARQLGEVVESCVNQVGVELNTASAPLLSHVAGVGPKLAERIVAHREGEGAFTSRAQLLAVKGLGNRTYEQAAGFLRVRGAKNPLDASAVHPERYVIVERMAQDLGVDLGALVSDRELVARLDLSRYTSQDLGEPTLRDIAAELEKPGRDPRQRFEPPRFREDVNQLSDLSQGMRLEGVVTNVTNFGAFVDVGVHQDGLVHISQLADHFVQDPHAEVKVGDRIAVRVLDVDLQRKRISLSARSEDGRRRND
jgi:uncharacterized protein